MIHISAREAKNGFGRLIDLARAEPVFVEKYNRPVVVVVAVEEYERLVLAAGGGAKGDGGLQSRARRKSNRNSTKSPGR